ncbi:MFS general substrate transporter [Lindgomyces ingoldianus]|uniref:MFS general substrate transporter n=1 Tax=Lindgomyces ingoldianus TaxID=673940 RepID=A0ACB6RCU8_9PLEO|nr:MFS general substrate transporter [Lindgomyces ingoldianus]KAF2476152.1 MFS general substrate transporter [Lindgomyces ingoldianus]
MHRPAWFSSLTQHGEKPPWLLKYRSSEGFIIGTVALAVFTDMFLYGVIVPVIPFALQERIHVTPNRIQYWVSVLIAVYGAALLAFSPFCGWLADHTSSRRSPLLLGLLALLGATVLLNVGSRIGVLIVARLLQGTSATVVWVVGLALLADTVPQGKLAHAMGYVAAGMSMGILVAPLLGGVVFDRAGYNAVFGMAYALVGIDIILRLLLVEKKVAARWDPSAIRQTASEDEATERSSTSVEEVAGPSNVDVEKDVQSAGRTPGLETGTSRAPSPNEPPTIDSPGPSRKRARSSLPPVLSLLYSRRLLAALFGSLVQAALMTAFDSVLTIHASTIFHWRSTGAALLFLPIVIPTFLAPVVGYMTDRYGSRYPAAIGFLLACPPFVCLRFIQENAIRDKVLLCALLALIGLTLTLTFPPFMAEISGVVEAKEKKMLERGEKGYGRGGAYAQAYGLFNMAFAGGCLVGPLLAGFVVKDRGWGTMAWVMGLLSAVTSVPTFLWMGGWVFGKK